MPPDQPKIVVLGWELPPHQYGGVGTLALATAQGLAAVGYEVEIWTRRPPPSSAGGTPSNIGGCSVRYLRGRSWARRHLLNLQLPSFRLRTSHSIVVASTWEAARATTFWGVPTITWVHGLDVLAKRGRFMERERRRTLEASRALVATSPWLAAEVVRLGHPAPHPVAPAVPVPAPSAMAAGWARLHPLPGGATIVALGRLVPRKGQDVSIRALGIMARRGQEVPNLVIAGDGPDRARLEGLARDEYVASKVVFVGRVSDVEKRYLLASSSLLAMPCREESPGDVEGFGLVFIEAALAGTPSIAGASGGAAAAIADGGGWLVDPLSPVALADRFSALLADPDGLRTAGSIARRRAEQGFHPEALGKRLVPIIEKVA